MTRATQTSTKPTQRPAGMSSPNEEQPEDELQDGARYCSRPSVTIGTRVAAAPKQISGMAVTMPAMISSSAWPAPCEAKLEWPVATSQPT